MSCTWHRTIFHLEHRHRVCVCVRERVRACTRLVGICQSTDYVHTTKTVERLCVGCAKERWRRIG
jgi:hypothetical protein